MKQYLEIGEVVSTHGIAGEMKLYPWADSADALRKVKEISLWEDGRDPIEVVSAREHKNMLLITLKGTETVEAARRFIGKTFYADRKFIKQPKGAYFVVDLLGLEVRSAEDGSHIGRVKDVTNTGFQDLYHVELDDGQVRMVPGVSAFIKDIKVEEGYVTVQPIKGLFSDED